MQKQHLLRLLICTRCTPHFMQIKWLDQVHQLDSIILTFNMIILIILNFYINGIILDLPRATCNFTNCTFLINVVALTDKSRLEKVLHCFCWHIELSYCETYLEARSRRDSTNGAGRVCADAMLIAGCLRTQGSQRRLVPCHKLRHSLFINNTNIPTLVHKTGVVWITEGWQQRVTKLHTG